jgi:hypothetical protein
MRVMGSTNISITIDGQSFPWLLGVDQLSSDNKVAVENYLRFFLKSLERKRSERQRSQRKDVDSYSNNPVTTERKGPKKKPIEQSLRDTALRINKHGLEKMQMESALTKFLEKDLRNGIVHLKPMTNTLKRTEWTRNRNETMIWLIYKYVGLAHARLVLRTFSSNNLDNYTP